MLYKTVSKMNEHSFDIKINILIISYKNIKILAIFHIAMKNIP
jgi:hypothetical protein